MACREFKLNIENATALEQPVLHGRKSGASIIAILFVIPDCSCFWRSSSEDFGIESMSWILFAVLLRGTVEGTERGWVELGTLSHYYFSCLWINWA